VKNVSRSISRYAVSAAAVAVLAAFSACSSNKGTNANDDERTGQGFIYLTDYQSAALAEYDAQDTSVTTVPVASLYTDVALRSYGGLLYVIERFGRDAVRVIDPTKPSAPLANYSVGNGTNPQDIVVLDEHTAYVFRLNTAKVLRIDPTTGDSTGTVDASAYADAADGKPELAGAVHLGETVWAIAQVLDTKSDPYFWPPTGPGKLLAIDPKSNAVTAWRALTIENPSTVVRSDDAVYVAGGPWGDQANSGIDEYRPADGAVRRVVAGTALHGQPTGLELLGDGTAWVLVAQEWPKASVYRINLASGAVLDSLKGIESPSAIGLGAANQLLVSDRSMTSPGVYVFDATTGSRIKGPISTALPPDAIAFLRK